MPSTLHALAKTIRGHGNVLKKHAKRIRKVAKIATANSAVLDSARQLRAAAGLKKSGKPRTRKSTPTFDREFHDLKKALKKHAKKARKRAKKARRYAAATATVAHADVRRIAEERGRVAAQRPYGDTPSPFDLTTLRNALGRAVTAEEKALFERVFKQTVHAHRK